MNEQRARLWRISAIIAPEHDQAHFDKSRDDDAVDDGAHCGHGARSTCALQFPTPSNGVIATRDISGNVPEPVLVVPDDEDKTMYRVIVARDLDLDTGSGVATQATTPRSLSQT
ncbi:hypothetical protein BC629DRAFT_1445666 [Irpex lacteus]|nr:hypothetical protein BC629DRAFT_1445666 [Irpex lacteus]